MLRSPLRAKVVDESEPEVSGESAHAATFHQLHRDKLNEMWESWKVVKNIVKG